LYKKSELKPRVREPGAIATGSEPRLLSILRNAESFS
jgi:hypothetical protein